MSDSEQPYIGNVAEKVVEAMQEKNPALKFGWKRETPAMPPPPPKEQCKSLLRLPHGALLCEADDYGINGWPQFEDCGYLFPSPYIRFSGDVTMERAETEFPALILAAMEALCADIREYLTRRTVAVVKHTDGHVERIEQ